MDVLLIGIFDEKSMKRIGRIPAIASRKLKWQANLETSFMMKLMPIECKYDIKRFSHYYYSLALVA